MEDREAEPKKDVNVRTAQLVQLLTELGPDIPEISRRLSQFKESVRYRYKEKILNKGFAVQAAPDHERLGLVRLIMIAEFADEYANYAKTILAAMSEICFVVSYVRTLPLGSYVVNFSVPAEYVPAVERFLNHLRENRMLSKLEILEFEWFKNAPMRAEFFDFDTGRWDFDWSVQDGRDFGAAAYRPSTLARYDHTDLLIIKELQKDGNKSLKEISDELKLNYKKLAWHYSSHVVARGLLKGFRVNWMGTRADLKLERPLNRKHKFIGVDIVVKDINDYERALLGKRFNQLPFLWAEAVGKSYFAELAFPVDTAVEGFQYLSDVISPVKDRTEVFVVDQANAAAFSIAYKMHDEGMKKWVFNEAELSARFENLMQQITEGRG